MSISSKTGLGSEISEISQTELLVHQSPPKGKFCQNKIYFQKMWHLWWQNILPESKPLYPFCVGEYPKNTHFIALGSSLPTRWLWTSAIHPNTLGD